MSAKPADPPTIVVFRVWPPSQGGDVLALFPELEHHGGSLCVSYQHIGQHAGASYHHCISYTRPATEAEYAPLLRELRDIGYDNLIIRQRYMQRRNTR